MTDSGWHYDGAEAGRPAEPGEPQPQPPGDPVQEPGTTGTPGAEPAWAATVPPDPGVPFPSGTPSDTVELGGPIPARRSGRTRIVVAVAAAVAVLAVVGIAVGVTSGGGSGAQGSPEQVLAAAVSKADTMTSATATYSEQVTGGSVSISASGTVTEIRQPLQMSMHMTETVGTTVLPLSAILTGDSIYFKFGAVSGLPASMVGKWLKITYSEIPGGSAIGSMLQSMSSENPSLQLQPLLAGRQVRVVGSQVIDGVATTEYKGTFTQSALVKELPASVRTQLGSMLKDLTGTAHFTAWVDGQDQVRQFAEQESVGAETVNVRITFLSFNQPATITVPPSSQVLPLPGSALGG